MYQSPFTLFSFEPPTNGFVFEKGILALERKRLLAEFELQGTDSIVIKGQELHRQDVVNLFDGLRNDKQLAFHAAIWQQKDLLNFLETGIFREEMYWPESLVDVDLTLLSSWFAEAQNHYFKRILNEHAAASVNSFLELPSFLTEGHYDKAFEAVNRYFIDKKNLLMRLLLRAKDGERISREEIKNWSTPAAIALLNALPNAYHELRYSIANALNDLAVHYDKLKRNTWAKVCIQQAAAIELSYGELATLIPKNLRIISDKRRLGLRKPKPIWIVFFLCTILLRLLSANESCNGTNHRYEYDTYEVGASKWDAPTTVSATYKSLLTAAKLHAITVEEKDGLMYKLDAPKKAGDNPLFPVFSAINNEVFLAEADSSKMMIGIRNTSKWDVLFVYLIDQKMAQSVFVPAHTNFAVSIPSDLSITIDVLAGNGWNATSSIVFENYSTIDSSIKSFTKGYFATLPTRQPLSQNALLEAKTAILLPTTILEVNTNSADPEGIAFNFTDGRLPASPGPFR